MRHYYMHQTFRLQRTENWKKKFNEKICSTWIVVSEDDDHLCRVSLRNTRRWYDDSESWTRKRWESRLNLHGYGFSWWILYWMNEWTRNWQHHPRMFGFILHLTLYKEKVLNPFKTLVVLVRSLLRLISWWESINANNDDYKFKLRCFLCSFLIYHCSIVNFKHTFAPGKFCTG